MKTHPLTLGICTLILFSCSKNNTKEETALKSSDTVMTVPPEKDDTPAEEMKELSKTETYRLVPGSKEGPGTIDANDIAKLSEPLKAIAALYSGLGGSGCEEGSCGLTTALGLGKQGLQAQKDLVKKWFRKDAAAEQLIEQNFYQAPSSSSNFSDFKYLNFEQKGDTVTVNYNLMT
ncbi:hypothetical protein [uncultured Chryseobacterium sp.]|uniref:hypothetical protein n=1 Tax=uncultured Chryseobacterium sp. TaxID=259322 RepID=UPI0025D2C51F|nr:hypothetical protein [uncultured Chryseobacterium sp.]